MTLKIAKWGDGLALLFPADVVRHLGLREGDQMQVALTVDGNITIRTASWDRHAFARELESIRSAMPMTVPVMSELRRGARY